MRDCVVFNGHNSLDFQDVRFNVIRIPEVMKRIQQAQEIWDQQDVAGFDLANFMASEDRLFLGNIKLKSLAAAIVQIGLYDRYVRYHSVPDFFIGSSTGDAPVFVAVGRQDFSDMVRESAALRVARPIAPVQLADDPQLSGMSLAHYAAFQNMEENGKYAYTELDGDGRDIHRVVLKILEEHEVKRFVNIGPGNLLLSRFRPELEMVDIQVLESIDMDPMLSWFWSKMRDGGGGVISAQ